MAGSRSFRNLIIAWAMIAAALVSVYLLRQRPERALGPRVQVAAKKGGRRVARTPILDQPVMALSPAARRRLLLREKERAAAEVRREEEQAKEARAEAERAARAADVERQGIARKQMEVLSGYRALLPPQDSSYYGHLLGCLADASAYGLDRPEDLEGFFLNRAFFAAGSWGKSAGFHRAWVYLFRALGMDLGSQLEDAVVKTAEDVFNSGMAETREIEAMVFGAPLEGGDPAYWDQVGLPPIEDCGMAWEARNASCVDLYAGFLGRLKNLLPAADFGRFCDVLEIFNLSS